MPEPYLTIRDFAHLKRDVLEAVGAEIEASVEEGGATYSLYHGVLLGQYLGKYVYQFAIDEEIRIPDGAPISLVSDSKRIPGSLISSEGFSVWVSSDEFISLESQWSLVSRTDFLLAELKKTDRGNGTNLGDR